MASGTIKSYTRPSGSYGAGAHWSFEWTSTKKSTGVSTVSWSLYTRGRSVSPTWLETGCWLSVGYNGKTTQVYAGEHTSGEDCSFVNKYRKSGTFDVTHNANGYASFTVNFEVYIYEAAHKSTSSTAVLDSLPSLATITKVANFNDEENPVISYSNPAGTAVTTLQACISLDGKFPGVVLRNASKTGTTCTFYLEEDERNVLREAVTMENSRTVTYIMKTVIGGEEFYDSKTATFSIANGDPVVTGYVEDVNPTTLALTGDSSKLVRFYSNAKATMVAEAQKGAVLDEDLYIIRNGDNTGYGTECTFDNVESNVFTFSAEDDRRNIGKDTVTATMIPYVKLTCNMSNNRPDGDGDMNVACTGSFFNGSFGAVSNTLTVQYRYKVSGGSFGSWKNMTVTKSGNSYFASASQTGLDYQSAYVFECQAIDKLETVSSGETTVASRPVFHWSKNDFVFEVPVTFNGGINDGTMPAGVDDGYTFDGDVDITGNLRLKGSGNYGNKLRLGDGDYCYISEPTDDCMTIHAKKITLDASSGVYLGGYTIPVVQYGTWTPALSSSAVSSYTTQYGWYSKVNQAVTVGFYVKATCRSGYTSTTVSISGLPFTPLYSAAGGGMCSGVYISAGFDFQCFVAETSGSVTTRVQACNNTSAGNLSTSASGCFYRSSGGEITLSGTITYMTSA